MKPCFHCERVVLREVRKSDANELYRNLSDPDVTRYYDMPPLRSEVEALGLIEKWRCAEATDAGVRWAIAVKDSDVLIGTCGLHAIDWRHLRGELGFELRPSWWGKGVMNEVLPKLFVCIFDDLGLDRIGATVVPCNTPSRALLRKFGFREEGLLKRYLRIGGKSRDVICMSLTRDELQPAARPAREVLEI